jgi:hypothetical protein
MRTNDVRLELFIEKLSLPTRFSSLCKAISGRRTCHWNNSNRKIAARSPKGATIGRNGIPLVTTRLEG